MAMISPGTDDVTAGPAGAGKLQDRTKAVVSPLGKRLWRFMLHGFDQLPAEGPAILCPNHVSFLDSAFLMLTLPRRRTRSAAASAPVDLSPPDRSSGIMPSAGNRCFVFQSSMYSALPTKLMRRGTMIIRKAESRKLT